MADLGPDLVGAELSLRFDDEDGGTEYVKGIVRKYNPPTSRYPAGRLSVHLSTEENNIIYLPMDQYEPSMLVSTEGAAVPPAAAAATTRATPAHTPGASVVGSLGSPPTTPYWLRARSSAGVSSAAGPARRSGTQQQPGGRTEPEAAASDEAHTVGPEVGAAAAGAAGGTGSGVGGTPGGDGGTPKRGRGRPPSAHKKAAQLASPPTSPRPKAATAAAAAGKAKVQPHAKSAAAQLASRERLRYVLNFVLLVAVAVPAVLYGVVLCTGGCHKQQLEGQLGFWGPKEPLDLLRKSFWCALGAQRPISAVMAVFTLNVDVLFWVISLLQHSTWLIDPYWTIVPPMIGLFYQYNPSSVTNVWRSRVVMGLLWTWSVRLTHSYFRREEWRLGAQEDWRYGEMKRQFGSHWWWVSIFAVYIAQQLMLVGVTLPVWAVHTSTVAWGPLDTLATVTAITGLLIAYVADTQLRRFMVVNEQRRSAGKQPILILDTGLWRYSRHPNYFGEHLWWWSIALFGLRVGQGWTAIGTFFNSFAMVEVTRMTEARMLRNPRRADAFRRYQAATSTWIPWFVRKL